MPSPKAPQFTGTVPCPACGAPLIAAVTSTGESVPLDVRALPTYYLVIHDGVPRVTRSSAYVSHAVTCGATQGRPVGEGYETTQQETR